MCLFLPFSPAGRYFRPGIFIKHIGCHSAKAKRPQTFYARRFRCWGYPSGGKITPMQWIIDGHNLIPHVRGLSLADLDDEQALIDLLVRFCRVRRDRVLVFFDRAQAGRGGEQKHGAVRAVFVPQPGTADAAIAAYLRKQGVRAKNDTLVSSDRMVQASARAHHLQVMSSSDFAGKIAAALASPSAPAAPEPTLSAEELQWWEQMFKSGKPNGK